jgi:FKBP-type peptidyl-prolyl cis-trans isomerase FklB
MIKKLPSSGYHLPAQRTIFAKLSIMGVADMLFKRKKELAEKNLKDGQEYMAEYGKRESVVELPSGLQYEIITEGDGEKPGPRSTVKCHYHGTTITGKVFDSSKKRNSGFISFKQSN